MTFFFYGANLYALRQQVDKMVAEYTRRAGSDFGLERIDGATAKPKELVGILQAAPFLANSRLVVITRLSANKGAIKAKELLGSVPHTTVAVFVEPAIDRRTSIFKELGAADKVIEFKPLSIAQMIAWASAEIARLGGTAERSALVELVTLIGDDQWRLSEELNKLVNYEPNVTRESVRRLVVAGVEQSIFELVDAMTAGRTAAALAAYHGLLARRENELYILTMVQWQLRNLLWAVRMPDGMTQAEFAKAAGISPFVAGKAMNGRRRYSPELIEQAYVAASEAEFDIKTGRTKAETAVEQLIYQVAASVAAKPS